MESVKQETMHECREQTHTSLRADKLTVIMDNLFREFSTKGDEDSDIPTIVLPMENGVIPLRHGSLPGALRLPKRYEQLANIKMSPASKRKSSIAPALDKNEDERMHDLMQAIMWVKQELILLRQHDVLLKRQFCDIQDTIHSLRKSKKYRTSHVTSSNTSLQSNESSEFGMDNYSVRSASSVTALDGSDTEDDEFRPRTSSMKTTRDLAALARRRGSKELI